MSWTPPPPPYCSPAGGDLVMIGLEDERTELTIKEVIVRVTDLQRDIIDIRKQKEDALAKRAAQRLEKERMESWRREERESVEHTGSELDESVEQLELQLHRVRDARNKKIIMHKKQRERLKREIAQIELAGQQLVNFELELLEAVAADARRLADHSRLVHEATLAGLNDKMESLVALGERQFGRNKELLVILDAEVLQQRSPLLSLLSPASRMWRCRRPSAVSKLEMSSHAAITRAGKWRTSGCKLIRRAIF